MSSIAPEKSSEGGGLQGTAQNLGASLGTAIVGAVLLVIYLFLVPGVFLAVYGPAILLGYLLGNPTYLSVHGDPRVGISPLEMAFLGLYAAAAIVSNPRLFLWRFLAAGWSNRIVFALLFANQFVAPLVVALLVSKPGSRGFGIELFVMLAGVLLKCPREMS